MAVHSVAQKAHHWVHLKVELSAALLVATLETVMAAKWVAEKVGWLALS